MKGQSSVVKIVAIVVFVSLVALVVIGSAGNILDSSAKVNENTSGEVNQSSEVANCIAECRSENPRGGPPFYKCKEDNDCE
jgi:hypothetical protein